MQTMKINDQVSVGSQPSEEEIQHEKGTFYFSGHLSSVG